MLDPATGSSPRVQGTLFVQLFRQMLQPVHPRVCGELFPLECVIGTVIRFIPACAGNTWRRIGRGEWVTVGSSPRVQGTRSSHARIGAGGRFIPACAGNTPVAATERTLTPVHPRVCGEHATFDVARHRLLRFIPACAGNTTTISISIPKFTVHPRVCREHNISERGPTENSRFIPACAGNTARPVPASTALPVHPRVCREHLKRSLAQNRGRG